MGISKNKNKDLKPSMIIISVLLLLFLWCVIIVYFMVWYSYISNKGILEECGKEENFEVIGAASTFCLKRRMFCAKRRLFCAMSRILQVTARPASL
jgi:hypothetical protein